MTRAQELRRLLREVEDGKWDDRPREALSAKIIGILVRRTCNIVICRRVLDEHYAHYAKEIEQWHARRLT